MSFPRHGEIYPCDEGAILRPRPRSSPWMSLQLGIPGGLLSSRARVRFPSQGHAGKLQPRRAMLWQRTAPCDLTGCLSRGVQSMPNHKRQYNFFGKSVFLTPETCQPKTFFSRRAMFSAWARKLPRHLTLRATFTPSA
jgi:hypothetical protein